MDTAGPVSVTDHAGERETLRSFRGDLYGCLTRRADALFELADTLVAGEAVATAPPPHLSLEPAFRRGWGSTYGALRRGHIAEAALGDLLAAWRPTGWPAVFAVDASSWPRCDAECSPERGYYHHPSRHSNGQPIVAGWNYSTDRPAQLAGRLVDRAARRPAHASDRGRRTGDRRPGDRAGRAARGRRAGAAVVFDAGYDPIALSVDLGGVRADSRCGGRGHGRAGLRRPLEGRKRSLGRCCSGACQSPPWSRASRLGARLQSFDVIVDDLYWLTGELPQ